MRDGSSIDECIGGGLKGSGTAGQGRGGNRPVTEESDEGHIPA